MESEIEFFSFISVRNLIPLIKKTAPPIHGCMITDQIGLHSLLIAIAIHRFIALIEKNSVSNRLIIQFWIYVER